MCQDLAGVRVGMTRCNTLVQLRRFHGSGLIFVNVKPLRGGPAIFLRKGGEANKYSDLV